MRRKQLFALLMAGALSVGMAPTASFAAENAAAANEEAGGEFDAADGNDETPSDETPETPADPTEAPADPTEAPADPTEAPADPTEAPADPTEAPAEEQVAAQSEGEGTIVIGDQSYTSLKEAFSNVPDAAENGDPTYIKIGGTIEVSETIDIPANKNIILAAAEENTVIKRAEGFKGSMFTVSGGMFQIAGGEVKDDNDTVISSGTLIVDGTGEDVEGSLVEVKSGVFGLSDGVTLTNNDTSANGGAISNSTDGQVYLMGGTITGNTAAAGGGIYSEGTVNLQGNVSVTENQASNPFKEKSNIVLAGDGVINVTGAVAETSSVGVSLADEKAGVTVVKLGEGDDVKDIKLSDVVKQLTYEGNTDSFKIGDDGVLADNKEEPPTPNLKKVVVKGKGMEWTGHNSVKITFRSNVDGKYYIKWVSKGADAPVISKSDAIDTIDANTNVTRTIKGLPEKDVDIYVCVVNTTDTDTYEEYGSGLFKPYEIKRPAAPTPTSEPTPTPHNAKIAKVEDSTIQGFEKALVFYPNTFYEFSAKGAGTDNTNPGEGDVRWVPVYWSMSVNPSSDDRHTTWKIGAQKGIYTDVEKTYPIYVFFQKQVYNGDSWINEEGSIESVQYQFKAAPLANVSGTPVPGGSDGTGGDGDGTGSGDGTDLTPTTYAGAANGTAKSAVSTGDESPIGTMLALAAASVLAGGYVLVRRRKKEL